MVLESYDTPRNEENTKKEEFVFPFHQEVETDTTEMFTFRGDNMKTYNLCSQKEPLMDGILTLSHPTPLILKKPTYERPLELHFLGAC